MGGSESRHIRLDINLDDPQDQDAGGWLLSADIVAYSQRLCGDAGLWHFGKRGVVLLFCRRSCRQNPRKVAEGIMTLRDATGYEVFPENPPGHVFVGDLPPRLFCPVDLADTGICSMLPIWPFINGPWL